jgi:hypothetical protein
MVCEGAPKFLDGRLFPKLRIVVDEDIQCLARVSQRKNVGIISQVECNQGLEKIFGKLAKYRVSTGAMILPDKEIGCGSQSGS